MSLVADEAERTLVKNQGLAQCIKQRMQSQRIKESAEKATWLGNDETHYLRLWKDHDLSHLKALLNLLQSWIEDEVEHDKIMKSFEPQEPEVQPDA